MNNFLEHNYNNDEIKNLIYLIDLNNDSLISYEEFQDFFIPLIKYTEEVYINNNNFDFNDNINDNENDLYNSNNYDNNIEKNDNDIVNYEKSGKYRANNSKEKYGSNANSDYFNKEKYSEKKYNSTFSQKPFNMENISYNNCNKTLKMDKNKNYINYNDYKDYPDFKDKNYNSMNNLFCNKNYLNKYNQEENQLKISQDEEGEEKYNNNKNNNNNSFNDNNNNYELDMDNDYDDYCNFYRKTQQLLTSSKKNNRTNSREKLINILQKTPNFTFQQTTEKKKENDSKDNNENLDKNIKNENKKNNAYNNIKNDNDYIINIIDKNNKLNENNNNNLNINRTQVQYVPINKINNILKIEKNVSISLLDKNKDKNKNKKNNDNSIKKEDNKININNFTCGGINESEKDNSSSKKNNISNHNESYTLSNDKNKIIKNINISHTHSNTDNNDINNNNNDIEENKNIILDSFSDRINKETLSKKMKEYNNTSLNNFIKYIQFIVKNEKKTIDSKDKLSLREDTTLKDLFCIFDFNKKNKISKREFKAVCKKILGLYPTSDQIILVYKRYDKDKDDYLNMKEFLGLIKPMKEEYTSFLFNKKNNDIKKNWYQQLNMKSKKLLVEVVKNIIEDEGNYYKYKDDMINQKLFELKDFWVSIVKYLNNNKGLDKIEMGQLLMNNGLSLSQYDIDILFNKMDYDEDQVMSYEDLTEEFVNYY